MFYQDKQRLEQRLSEDKENYKKKLQALQDECDLIIKDEQSQ